MPIYSYKCRDCGQISDIFLHSYSEKANCPTCGSKNMEKLVTAPYSVRTQSPTHGSTCCGRAERCDKPPCSTDEGCRRGKRHG